MLALSVGVSVSLQIYAPSPFQSLVLVLNLAFVGFQFVIAGKKEKAWGVVYDAVSLEPVPLAVISIFDTKENKLLKERLSDYFGRFNFLTPPGSYRMTVSKPNYLFPAKKTNPTNRYRHPYHGEPIVVKKKRAIVKTDIPLERKGLSGT